MIMKNHFRKLKDIQMQMYILKEKNRVSTELKLKFQQKFEKKVTFFSLLGKKTLSSSRIMNFDTKFQPLKMWSNYCHKVLSDIKISNKFEFPI